MKVTDYSKIAENYDKNKLRHDIARDDNIGILYASHPDNFTVLGFACGTGNYLSKQIAEYQNYNISWIGIDKSPEMLGKAKEKNLDANLLIGDACQIPLPDDSIDYVKIRLALHHFPDKEKAIREVRRILKRHGVLSIFSISHDYMKYSWVCRYFPGVEEIDKARFPSSLEIFQLLEKNGFSVSANIKTIIKKYRYDEIIGEAINRDMSQLNLISEDEYINGLHNMKIDAKKSDYLFGDISFLDLYAEKSA
jgi:ubiquinone/menaquinone biosynthesis C-methylase UbiE